MFILLLTSLINTCNIVNSSNHTKYVSLSNQKYNLQPTLINLHPNEYSQGLNYYPCAIKLDKCVGSCNALMTYLIKYVFEIKQNTHVFNMITGENESTF